jgi:histidine triad (HIT) family protein
MAMGHGPVIDRDCAFCGRFQRGDYDYDDRYNVSFRPLSPVTPGHFLVIPKMHVADALESPAAAGRALRFAVHLANLMSLESANFITSAGSAATQTVFHLHVHVVPRRPDDGVVLPWTGQER